ncbi:MAG: GNAT family N-acetyltransferase [Peptostreptococcaceae bacterium]
MIRYAKEKETTDVEYIWNYCFDDTEDFVNYYFNDKYKLENNVVMLEDNEVVSSLQLNKYRLNLNNKLYDTSYVVGVSTLPENRGRGFMKDIMKFSLNEMYKNDELISILMPIDFRLYRKFGYENCYDINQYELDINEISNFRISGTFKKVNDENIEELIKIKNRCLKNYNGNIERDNFYYLNLLKETKSENGHIYINDQDGYLVYMIKGSSMFIREIYYKNITSLKSMLAFIYNHNTQVTTITINTPIEDNIKLVLNNPKDTKIFVKPFMMGRIINVKGFLESLEIPKIDGEFTCKFKVKDEYIEENENVYELTLTSDKLYIEIVEDDYLSDTFDINSFSQICFSYLDLDNISLINDIEVSDDTKKVFDILFKKKNNYINEYV